MKTRQTTPTQKLAAFIVDKRYVFFTLYLFVLAFCLISMNWTVVENDVTVYLKEDSETRMGIEAMNANFVSFGTARVMVKNVTPETAQTLADRIAAVDGITMVTFDTSDAHYQDAAALIEVTFTHGANYPKAIAAMDTIREMLADYDLSVDTTVGVDMNAMLDEEMLVILAVAVVLILVVLTLTSQAYAEVPVLLLTFGAAALMNMGTNFIFPKISFISDSVAVVLQLALAIDYAVILCHRFNDEHVTKNARNAAVDALAKAIPEISASSMTTITGLAALGFMEFGIGLDMAMVLVKSIFLSLLSVFTLMPGLLVLLCPLMDKTRHRKLLPNISFLGKFAVKTRRVLPPIFLLTLVGAFYLSSNCPYCYSFNDMRTAKMSEQQTAYFEIKETFGPSNMLAVVVPVGDYEKEAALLTELAALPEVKSAMGLANIEAIGGYKLTDALTPREFSQLIGLDYEVAQALYGLYALDGNQYGQLLDAVEGYRVPMFDMFLFLVDQMESRNITLSGDGLGDMAGMLSQLTMARDQMQSDHYSRMVLYLNLPEEGPETFAFLEKAHDIVGKYYEGDYYLVGNSTSCRDLSASFSRDNLLISVLSAFFVIMVLLFTFKSAGLPVLLILVIQGSIWINFSIPTLMNQPLYFLGYLIVNALQMGANIDYAIVISSHYQELKTRMPHKEAIVHALNEAFPTVFTSGIMMASAGLLIGNMSAQPVVSIMGTCIGRGTIVSIVLVLLVLPSILVLGDSIIERTRFRLKLPTPPHAATTGAMTVKGHIRGYISGMVDADFNGLLRGQLDATISTETTVTPVEETEDLASSEESEPAEVPTAPVEETEEGGASHA